MTRRRRREAEGEGGAGHERWLISYADLITVLLVFFIVLYSISQADAAKFQRFSSSVQAAFNVEVTRPSAPSGHSGIENDPRFMSYLTIRAQISALLGRLQLDADQATVELTREGIVIHVSDSLLFAPSDAQLRPEAARLLDGLAAIIGPLPTEVRIEGHTDNVPPAGDRYPDNWTLSVLRAVAAVRYLTDRQGVPPERLSAVGHGPYRPVADNGTLEGRRQNRRVDFVIVQPSWD